MILQKLGLFYFLNILFHFLHQVTDDFYHQWLMRCSHKAPGPYRLNYRPATGPEIKQNMIMVKTLKWLWRRRFVMSSVPLVLWVFGADEGCRPRLCSLSLSVSHMNSIPHNHWIHSNIFQKQVKQTSQRKVTQWLSDSVNHNGHRSVNTAKAWRRIPQSNPNTTVFIPHLCPSKWVQSGSSLTWLLQTEGSNLRCPVWVISERSNLSYIIWDV